jgi:hypothetical protein
MAFAQSEKDSAREMRQETHQEKGPRIHEGSRHVCIGVVGRDGILGVCVHVMWGKVALGAPIRRSREECRVVHLPTAAIEFGKGIEGNERDMWAHDGFVLNDVHAVGRVVAARQGEIGGEVGGDRVGGEETLKQGRREATGIDRETGKK